MLIINTAENGMLKVTLKWGNGGKGSGKGTSVLAANAHEATVAVRHYFGGHADELAAECPLCRAVVAKAKTKGLS